MTKRMFIYIVFMFAAFCAYGKEIYNANIMIDTNKKTASGYITIESDKDNIIYLDTTGFYDVLINGAPLNVTNRMAELALKSKEEKKITFKKELSEYDIISDNFISVYNIAPSVSGAKEIVYNLSISLPKGFEAVSSGETALKEEKEDYTKFTFSTDKPISRFDVIASSEYHINTIKTETTEINAYFFKENKDLAEIYLENAAKYIKIYENLFKSPFPYKRFSIVEHKNPAGYASPAYTVLGSSIIKLPFILSHSLPHEILHQWFGCAIERSEGGSWYEAMATYFGDIYNLPSEKERAYYRKDIINSYENYTSGNKDYPLNDFRHRDSKLSQSIGYGKGAMVLNMIRIELGDKLFYEGISNFIKNYEYKKASWKDIFNSFGNKKIKTFSEYWLNEKGIPEISVSESSFIYEKSELKIKFTLSRKGGPKTMTLPYKIVYKDGIKKGIIVSPIGEKEFLIPVKNNEAKLLIDSDYEIMRHLNEGEKPTSLSAIFAAENIVGVKDGSDKCDSLFKTLNIKNIKDSRTFTYADYMNNTILVCGYNNPALNLSYPDLKTSNENYSEYIVMKNPYSDGKYIMAANNPLNENIRLLRHYGAYSNLIFDGEKNIKKERGESAEGIEAAAGQGGRAVFTKSALELEDVIKKASEYPAIFIGERHNEYVHHYNQLQIIKGLYERGVKIAVGFEMVQKQFQDILSSYVSGEISELDFLMKTEYYDRWGFDYNLYAPLFRYLRKNKIPAIALNADTGIIKKISSGEGKNLSEYELSQIPKTMKINNPYYEKEIKEIFKRHKQKDGADKSFSDFFTAQNIWDETMAESAANFQKNNPDYTIAVIAGSGHLGKNSGIPLRYERITGNQSFVIIQDDDIESLKSDAVLFTEPIFSEGTPSIGVTLNISGDNIIVEKTEDNSPAKEAGIFPKDIIISCGDYNIGNKIGVLKYALFEKGYGSDITCRIKRGKSEKNIKIKLTPFKQYHREMMKKMGK